MLQVCFKIRIPPPHSRPPPFRGCLSFPFSAFLYLSLVVVSLTKLSIHSRSLRHARNSFFFSKKASYSCERQNQDIRSMLKSQRQNTTRNATSKMDICFKYKRKCDQKHCLLRAIHKQPKKNRSMAY